MLRTYSLREEYRYSWFKINEKSISFCDVAELSAASRVSWGILDELIGPDVRQQGGRITATSLLFSL